MTATTDTVTPADVKLTHITRGDLTESESDHFHALVNNGATQSAALVEISKRRHPRYYNGAWWGLSELRSHLMERLETEERFAADAAEILAAAESALAHAQRQVDAARKAVKDIGGRIAGLRGELIRRLPS